jgi:hypothetical protein
MSQRWLKIGGLWKPVKGAKNMNTANVKAVLDDTMLIDGAVGAALVDWKSGMCLGTAGGQGLNLEVAAAGNTEVVKAKMKTMSALGLRDTIEDILITMGSQYHLIRIVKGESSLFVYLALNKANSNLAMARHQLSAAEKKLA